MAIVRYVLAALKPGVDRAQAETELTAILEWCSDNGHCTIPYGGGSSVVEGVTPPEDRGPIVVIVNVATGKARCWKADLSASQFPVTRASIV